jgi:hypothetical protein
MLEEASMGVISDTGAEPVADDLDGLIDQTERLFIAMGTTMDQLGNDLIASRMETVQLSLQLDEMECVVENLLQDIAFDEALDHATLDLMDGIASSGDANTTANGDLQFDARATFTKSELKPILREAIIRWISVKLAM